MSAIAARSPGMDPLRVSVLACLHLADRLRGLEQELNQLKSRVEQKTQQFRLMLDHALENEPADKR
jgi:cell division protein ZapA